MKNQPLGADMNGEFSKPVSAVLAMVSLSTCLLAWLLVRQALPREASLAHLALLALLVGAVPGLFQILRLTLKTYQGGRLRFERNAQ